MTRKIILLAAIILIPFGCKEKSECRHESWKYIDLSVDSNCNFYMMYFLTGDYMFRISSSGKCDSLTKEVFINKYEKILKEHQNEIPIKSGKIIFDYYSFKKDPILTVKLMKLTELYFKAKTKIIENSDELVIEVY